MPRTLTRCILRLNPSFSTPCLCTAPLRKHGRLQVPSFQWDVFDSQRHSLWNQPQVGIPSPRSSQSGQCSQFDTLADVALTGIKGEPIDDKTYLMERPIQLTADLPLHDRVSDTLTNNFLGQLWNDLEHPPKSYLGYEYAFRKPDGSDINILGPHIGASGQPYARSARAQKLQPPSRPDPGIIIDSVLARKEFTPQPNGISSVLFYMAGFDHHP
jgi:hypothetical protein